MRPKDLSEVKTMHDTENHSIPIGISDDIKTMSHSRSLLSIPTSLRGCYKTKDDNIIRKYERLVKISRLRKENRELNKRIHQLESILQ